MKNLPTDLQYSKFEKENPFSLYCSYLDYVRPVDLADAKADRAALDSMDEERFKAMQQEYETCRKICEMY